MNKSRYNKILFFFARIIANVVLWDLILRRVGFRKIAERTRSRRLVNYARRFRYLAVNMGGVMIKVGQFLSARADVMPVEITDELSGLQDEVPAEKFEEIKILAESELEDKLNTHFSWFDETPLAAASLGQVHRARLKKGTKISSGKTIQDVVVKIQRPNIEEIVKTDLAALKVVGKWVMRYRPLRKRADVPALLEEFAATLYEEIDYVTEGKNAEQFSSNFKENPHIRVPGVIWEQTTKRVLTLEDVYAIKITDYDKITQAGIDREAVAKRLFDVYLSQIFEDGFFHADPHPGNLFINPVDISDGEDQKWELTFVDFGMVGHIPPNTKVGLRQLAIGIGTKDTKKTISALQSLDVLLPNADLELIAQAEAAVTNRFWGKSMEELRAIPLEDIHEIAIEFRELIYAMPFQVPQDMIYLARTIAILSGMCTGLDPKFNFFENITPYAVTLVAEENGSRWDTWISEIGAFLLTLVALPKKLESVLGRMERGALNIQNNALERQLRYTNRTLRQLVNALLFFALLSNGIQLHINQDVIFSRILLLSSLIPLFLLIIPPRRHP